MTQNTTRAILLDIEGTTTPISFVHDVLFPYSRRHLENYLQQHANSPELSQDLARFAKERETDVDEGQKPPPLFEPYVYWLMERDRKSPALKSLQGKIWRQGYSDGSLRASVFADVVPALKHWHSAGLDISIFSSGSRLAQRLLFQHTEAGDLTKYISHYFDTDVGKKTDSESYEQIAVDLSLPTNEILFISDVVAELSAARTAGLQTLLSIRPGNPAQQGKENFQSVESFKEIAN